LRLKQCHYFNKNQRLDGEVFAGGDFQAKPTYTKGQRGGIMFLLSWAMHLAESSQMPKVEVLPMVQRKNL
jgi:hypothetical protein